MTKEEFHILLKKYIAGACTDDEREVIEKWYARLGDEGTDPMSLHEEEALRRRYWQQISGHIAEEKASMGTMRRAYRWPAVMGMAAAVSVVVACFMWLAVRTENDPVAEPGQPPVAMRVVNNDGREAREVLLPDGSRVLLHEHSRLSFPPSFSEDSRRVYLEGGAFFEVKRDTLHPFLVRSEEVTTRVLGTSFTINAFREHHEVTVSVKTGRVSVYTAARETDAPANETILTPNQKIVYNRDQQTMVRTLVSTPQPVGIANEQRRVQFESAPVAEIFHTIEEMYQVEVLFDEAQFASCRLTTVLSGGSLYNRLDIICAAMGAHYAVEGTRIVISGAGCVK